ENILAATEQAPSVGTKSWGRRFTVTKYLPRDPAYGKFNTGITSTLWKADPKARIVAVDPKLIPYGPWVWIDELGWYRAQAGGARRHVHLQPLPVRAGRRGSHCRARPRVRAPWRAARRHLLQRSDRLSRRSPRTAPRALAGQGLRLPVSGRRDAGRRARVRCR